MQYGLRPHQESYLLESHKYSIQSERDDTRMMNILARMDKLNNQIDAVKTSRYTRHNNIHDSHISQSSNGNKRRNLSCDQSESNNQEKVKVLKDVFTSHSQQPNN